MTAPQDESFDPELVIAQLSQQIGALTAQIAIRDSALTGLRKQLDKLRTQQASQPDSQSSKESGDPPATPEPTDP